MFAPDLGHWDVPDTSAVLPEAWELVERGHVTADDVMAFKHDNALALWETRCSPTPSEEPDDYALAASFRR